MSIAYLLTFVSLDAQAQDHTPKVLTEAAHCLAVKDFLSASEHGVITLGYIVDEHSYPGEKVIYVVSYAGPKRSSGVVFAVFFTESGSQQSFDIQNNAGFTLSKNEPSGVSFVTPPLGGIWTQEHLAAGIRQIVKQSRYPIPARDLLAADSSTQCKAYIDR